jgi:hypothetical protein
MSWGLSASGKTLARNSRRPFDGPADVETGDGAIEFIE